VLDSFVVRLIGRERLQRRIVGHVDVVATGERVRVSSGEELLEILAAGQNLDRESEPTTGAAEWTVEPAPGGSIAGSSTSSTRDQGGLS
jgi:hypothetical protein